jgi:ABC-type amino acid transport substrate-binding protein
MKRSLPITVTLALACVTLSAALPVNAQQEKAGGRLTACVDADNPPFSNAGAGIDAEIAKSIAASMQRELTISAVPVPSRGGLGKALKQTIQAGKCDFFVGIPEEEDLAHDLAERRLVASRTYLSVGYLLVRARSNTGKVANNARFGAVTATPADLYLLKEKANRVPYGNNKDLIEAVRSGDVQRALVWSPAIARQFKTVSESPLSVEAKQPTDPILRTELKIITRAADKALGEAINQAITDLISGGRISTIAEAHGLPLI